MSGPPAAIATVDAVVMVPIRRIKPYERNPRKNETTIQKLIELIPKVGFNVPLVLDRQNIIVKGHSRWRAAVRLKMKALPCVYTDADEETIKLDRLADNRVQEFSTWDTALLASELGSLDLPFDLDLGLLEFSAVVPALDVTGAGIEPAAPASAPAAADNARDAAPGPAQPSNQPPASGKPSEPPQRSTRQPAMTVSEAPPADDAGYTQVVCYNCGKRLYVSST